MTWLFSLLTGLPGFLNGVLTYLNKKQDNALEQFRIGNTNGKEVAVAVVLAEQARIAALKEVTISAMSHPIWWCAWALFVFPVALYEGCIFWVSTFPGLGWAIQHVPPAQDDFARLVAGSMFGIAGASTLATGIAQAWQKRA